MAIFVEHDSCLPETFMAVDGAVSITKEASVAFSKGTRTH